MEQLLELVRTCDARALREEVARLVGRLNDAAETVDEGAGESIYAEEIVGFLKAFLDELRRRG